MQTLHILHFVNICYVSNTHRINDTNNDRVTPVQLVPELEQMQQRWVEEICLVAFGFPPSALTEVSSNAGGLFF